MQKLFLNEIRDDKSAGEMKEIRNQTSFTQIDDSVRINDI
jgi:hypothetical protein